MSSVAYWVCQRNDCNTNNDVNQQLCSKCGMRGTRRYSVIVLLPKIDIIKEETIIVRLAYSGETRKHRKKLPSPTDLQLRMNL